MRIDSHPPHGEIRECLDRRWFSFLKLCGIFPLPLPTGYRLYDATSMVSELSLSGIILTGGNDLCVAPNAKNAQPERDAWESDLIKICKQENLPLLGICRGAQMLGIFHGLSLKTVPGHIGTRHQIVPCTAGDTWFPGRREVNSFHGYGFAGATADIEPLAVCETDGSLEAFSTHGRRQIGIMWHPEREKPHDPRDVLLAQSLFGVAP